MPDDVDRCVELETAWLDGQVHGVRQQLRAPGTLECTDCGEEIPPLRRKEMPSARRCVACQTLLEGGR